MKRPVIALASSLVFVAGCSGQSQNQAEPAQNVPAAAAPAPAPPATPAADPERGRRYAECAQVLEAMGNLYDAIASQRTGAEAEDMRARATQRRSASGLFEQEAIAAGLTAEAVRGIRTETAARLQQEQSGQDFGDFMLGLGRQADGCAALVQGGG